jgi:hypothetical protein
MPKNVKLFTLRQLQKRWDFPYERVREKLVQERIPVIALSGGGTLRIPVYAILKLERRHATRS